MPTEHLEFARLPVKDYLELALCEQLKRVMTEAEKGPSQQLGWPFLGSAVIECMSHELAWGSPGVHHVGGLVSRKLQQD